MDFKASENVPGDVTNELETGAGAGDEKAVTMKTTDTGSDALIAAKATEALGNAMIEAAKDAAKTDSKK
ncbi:MAG: ribonucleotide-diphosphate reductase subunit alpha, partial [Erythrobacter sp.]|nr:ribonucleotide-diphosphate reductase subunit alpha [Erythrobacter sp.]